jgi:signal transduction histidine kinase
MNAKAWQMISIKKQIQKLVKKDFDFISRIDLLSIFMLIISTIYLLALCVSTYTVYISCSNSLEDEYIAYGKTTSDALAKEISIINEYTSNKSQYLAKEVLAYTGRQKNIGDAMLISAGGNYISGNESIYAKSIILTTSTPIHERRSGLIRETDEFWLFLSPVAYLNETQKVAKSDAETKKQDYVALVQKKDSLLSANRNILAVTITSAIAIAIIGIIILNYIAKRLMAPLTALQNTMKVASIGKHYAKAPITGTRDITRMSTKYNQLMDTLHSQNNDLIEYQKSLLKQIEQSEMLAVMAMKDVSAYDYTVSHDLRGPLNVFSGYLQMLQRDFDSGSHENTKRYIEGMVGAVKKMESFIGGLTHVSGLSKRSIALSYIDIGKMVNEIILRMAEEDPIINEFTCSVQNEIYANVDASLIRVCLTKLIDNAIKFTAKCKTKRLQFYFTEVSQIGPAFVLADTGVGFDMKYADRLFFPFNSLHSPKDFTGEGLGLAIVQRIISLHGGKIIASSEPDKGTIFTFSLPLRSKNGNH